MTDTIIFVLNGQSQSWHGNPLRRLLDVLRNDYGLTGVKEGCGEGECGACAVLLDGALVNSCLLTMGQVQDRQIMTIEGFAKTPRFAVLEKAFLAEGGIQCGFCTPGMLLAAEALLRREPHPTETEVRRGISGNLCRCTGYNMIVAAILQAAQWGNDLW